MLYEPLIQSIALLQKHSIAISEKIKQKKKEKGKEKESKQPKYRKKNNAFI